MFKYTDKEKDKTCIFHWVSTGTWGLHGLDDPAAIALKCTLNVLSMGERLPNICLGNLTVNVFVFLCHVFLITLVRLMTKIINTRARDSPTVHYNKSPHYSPIDPNYREFNYLQCDIEILWPTLRWYLSQWAGYTIRKLARPRCYVCAHSLSFIQLRPIKGANDNFTRFFSLIL